MFGWMLRRQDRSCLQTRSQILRQRIQTIYPQWLLRQLQKAVVSELTTMVMQIDATPKVSKQIADELLNHAFDELQHLRTVVNYISNHYENVKIQYCLDSTYVDRLCSDDELEILSVIQEAEMESIRLYTRIIQVADIVGDIETVEIFEDILKTETKHYDDFANKVGGKRPFLLR